MLLRYVGVVVELEPRELLNEEYFGITGRAEDGVGVLAGLILKRAVSELRELKQRLEGKEKNGDDGMKGEDGENGEDWNEKQGEDGKEKQGKDGKGEVNGGG